MLDKLTILQELKQLLHQHFPDTIKDVILFGSQVTKTAHSDSDYDVLIVLKKRCDWKQKKALRYVCYDIALKFSIRFKESTLYFLMPLNMEYSHDTTQTINRLVQQKFCERRQGGSPILQNYYRGV